MRSIEHAERTYMASLVEQTRRILAHSDLPDSTKLQQIRDLATICSQRLASLRRRRESVRDARKLEQLNEVMSVRQKGIGYLKSVSTFLSNQVNHSMTLREPPTMFNDPVWKPLDNPVVEAEPEDDFPFMEFSS